MIIFFEKKYVEKRKNIAQVFRLNERTKLTFFERIEKKTYLVHFFTEGNE